MKKLFAIISLLVLGLGSAVKADTLDKLDEISFMLPEGLNLMEKNVRFKFSATAGDKFVFWSLGGRRDTIEIAKTDEIVELFYAFTYANYQNDVILRALDTSSHILSLTLDESYIGYQVSLLYCPSLRHISCNNTLIVDLSVSGASALKTFELSGNHRLKGLELSWNQELENLTCTHNDSLAAVNFLTLSSFSEAPFKLKMIDCSNNNRLKVLRLKNAPDLETLNCSNNPLLGELELTDCPSLIHLKFSNLPQLTQLRLTNTKLATLDLLPYPNLESLTCRNNDSLITLCINNPKLKWLYWNDLSALRYLSCLNTKLLDLSFSTFDSLPALQTFVSSGNHSLKRLYLSNMHRLEEFICTYNDSLAELYLRDCPLLDSLDFLENIQLKKLTINTTNLRSLDLSVAPNLEYFMCRGRNDSIVTLYIDNPKLEYLYLHTLPSLRYLSCRNTKLSDLSFSAYDSLPALQMVECSDNPLLQKLMIYDSLPSLKTLKCSGNRSLKRLYLPYSYGLEAVICTYNDSLERPELPYKGNFRTVDCSNNNQLNSLSLLNQPALKTVKCTDNPLLERLELIDCPSLDSLNASGLPLLVLQVVNTKLGALDLAPYPNLEYLTCFKNDSLTTLYIDHPKLAYLYLHDLPSLQHLSCRNTKLSNLSFSTYDSLPALQMIECSDNPLLQALTFGDNSLPSLQTVDCSNNNQLNSLSLLNQPALKTVKCTDNSLLERLELVDCPLLDSLDFSGNIQLRELFINNTKLRSLDLSVAPNLEELRCNENDSLTTLYIDNPKLNILYLDDLPSLRYLSCWNTMLSDLSFSTYNSLPALKKVECSGNRSLKRLYLEDKGLEELTCTYNDSLEWLTLLRGWNLKTIKCTDNPLLEGLELIDLSLDSLDFSGNTKLKELFINNTKLRSLDLSVAPNLEELQCNGNDSLTMLMVDNPVLQVLRCDHNRLETLFIDNASALKTLLCNHNQLTFLHLPADVILESLTCDSNSLTLSNVADLVKQMSISSTGTMPQLIPVLRQVGQALDLRSEMKFNDKDTEWNILDADGNIITDYTNTDWGERNGSFFFNKTGKYRIVLNHSALPNYYGYSCPAEVFYDVTVVDSVARPVFSEPSGAVRRHTPISLSTTTPDAQIYYTVDGSAPDSTALLYTEPIYIDDSVTIKAIAIQDTLTSGIAMASYTIAPPDTIDNEHGVLASQARIYVKDKIIYVPETIGEVEVFTANGQCVYRGAATTIPVKRSGLYVVVAKAGRWKVAVR